MKMSKAECFENFIKWSKGKNTIFDKNYCISLWFMVYSKQSDLALRKPLNASVALFFLLWRK